MDKRKKKQRTDYLKHTVISLEILINDYYSIGYINSAMRLQEELDDIEEELEVLETKKSGGK